MSNAIKLQSMEGEIFDVDIRIAKMSGTIKTILEDSGADGNDDTVIPLPNVKSNILRKILQWSQFHKDDPSVTEPDGKKEKRTDDISLWDAEFLNVDQSILLDLILAAKYLEIKGNFTINPYLQQDEATELIAYTTLHFVLQA